jgi:tripartite-type tricarboxylate transporter receptor subunit TctC
MKRLNGLAIYGLVQLIAILLAGEVFSQADFYKGKTIKIIRGGGPGGSGEFQTRALMKVLEKHIPGQPRLMMEYVEGAAGRKAANLIYNSTRPTGSPSAPSVRAWW